MSCKRTLSVAFVLTVALAISTCQAQPGQGRGRGPGFGGFGGGGFGFGSSLLTLAQNDAVKKELEVLDDQAKAIEKLADEIRSQRGDQPRPDFQNMSEQERNKFMADVRARQEKESATANAKLAEILLPPQMKRLTEISIRVRGVSALTDAKVAAELNLTDAQKERIETIQSESRSKMGEMFQGGDRQGAMEKMASLRKETESKALAVLTAEQAQKFEQLKGAPFEMPQGGFGRGGGQRGRDGGGRKQ